MGDWNEIIKQNLTSLIEFVKQGAKAVGDQVPKYIEELIKFEVFKNALIVGVLVACFILMAVIAYKIWVNLSKKIEENPNNEGAHAIRGVTVVISFIVNAVLLATIVNYTIDLGKVLVAPRVYVVERIQTMIK